MKKIILIFSLLLIQTLMIAQTSITVMFYNVENFFDTVDDPKTQDEEFLPTSELVWDDTKYNNKIKRIAKVIDSSVAGIGLPDVVGFCEIENKSVLTDLINKSNLKINKYEVLATTGIDDRGINVGLIYNPAVFEFIKSEELNVTSTDIGNYKTRNILWVTLKCASTKEVIYFFVNHWPSRRDGEIQTEPKRLYAAKLLRAKLDELQKQNANAKIIVMGDLNDYPTNTSVLNTLKANANPQKGSNELLNPYFNIEKNKQGTHYDRGEWHVFDHIILSQAFIQNSGLQFKNFNAFILKKDFLLFKNNKTGEIKPNRTYGFGNKYYNGYSDHLAIYIQLTL